MNKRLNEQQLQIRAIVDALLTKYTELDNAHIGISDNKLTIGVKYKLIDEDVEETHYGIVYMPFLEPTLDNLQYLIDELEDIKWFAEYAYHERLLEK